MSCPCVPTEYPWPCPVHGVVKTEHWVELCHNRPQYRELWDAGRGPGQDFTAPVASDAQPIFSHWLTCPKRGKVVATVSGSVAGCGCSTMEIQVYDCEHFNEPVLKQSDPRNTDRIRRQVPLYTGRQCKTCEMQSVKEDSVKLTISRDGVPLESEQFGHGPLQVSGDNGLRQLAEHVTLICIDCVDPQAAALALGESIRNLRFARALLLSHERPGQLPPGVDWRQIPKLCKEGYNLFCLRALADYVETSHVLTIQTDGYVINPTAWNANWLGYDYIGAPWPNLAGWIHAHNRVGNSGFCLRSRKLLKATQELATEGRLRIHQMRMGEVLDDVFTCVDCYPDLSGAGLRFAPPKVAAKFAVERETCDGGDVRTSFGFHGLVRPAIRRATAAAAATGPKIRLAMSFFVPANSSRKTEVLHCLWSNLVCSAFDEVVLITDRETVVPYHSPKIRTVQLDLAAGERPTYAELFAAVDSISEPDDVRVVANADLEFDRTAAAFAKLPASEWWTLGRHESARGGWHPVIVGYSQDVWAWRGRCRIPLQELAFTPGTVACDNVLAYVANAAGYQLRNPCLSIVARHYHADWAKTRSALDRLPAPYAHVMPGTLASRPKIQIVPTWTGGAAPSGPDEMLYPRRARSRR